jgi:hypothetical protein
MFFNHQTLIDAQLSGIVYRATVLLEAGVFYDVVINYIETVGTASIKLEYESQSISKQVVPRTAFYTTADIVSSPFATTIIPGSADYPNTYAYGTLVATNTGLSSTIFIQTADSAGNNANIDAQTFNPEDIFTVAISETDSSSARRSRRRRLQSSASPTYDAVITYLGNGLYSATYTILLSGEYEVSIQLGGNEIQCGQGESGCSPFNLAVAPAPTTSSMTEVESPAGEAMDYLVEAIAGQQGTLYLQAKDALGNNKDIGGDDFIVSFTSEADSSVIYKGQVDDNKDGTFRIRYTIPVVGNYHVEILLLSTAESVGEPVLKCIGASEPFVYTREYDGINAYFAPDFCSLDQPLLKVVHNDISPDHSNYVDPDKILQGTTVGVLNEFTIESRDVFYNLRIGDNTTHFIGYGDGESDYFLAEFTNRQSGDYVRRTTAINQLTASNIPAGTTSYFRLSFGGKTTDDIPSNVTAVGLESILEELHSYQLDVIVTKDDGVDTVVTPRLAIIALLNP